MHFLFFVSKDHSENHFANLGDTAFSMTDIIKLQKTKTIPNHSFIQRFGIFYIAWKILNCLTADHDMCRNGIKESNMWSLI